MIRVVTKGTVHYGREIDKFKLRDYEEMMAFLAEGHPVSFFDDEGELYKLNMFNVTMEDGS